jgi:tetratricopeptide (TPR) repeat protein
MDYREAVAALNRGDLKTAEMKLEEVVRLTPASEQGYAALGVVFLRESRMAEAIRELQKALSIKPGDASAELNLASAYEIAGDPARAVQHYGKAMPAARAQRQLLTPDLLASYARALAATGQLDGAIARMKEAAALEPRSAQMHDNLGSLYGQKKDWPRAEQEFGEAARLEPEFALAHLHLGFVLQVEQKPEAVQEWLLASKLAPDDASLQLLVGKAIADTGQDAQALPVLDRAHALAPRSPDAAYPLALVLQRLNRVDEAIPLLKIAVAAQPDNADALINLGLALGQAHRAREGIPFLQRAIALKTNDLTAHQDLAAAYLQVNETDAAIGELQTALKLAPDSPQLHYNLGAAYKIEDDAAHAIPELEMAAKLDPNAYEPQYVLGVLYMQQARYEEAATRLEASLKLHPQNGDGWATLGSVYNKMDKLPEAVAALREAIRQLPDQADPHLTLAAVLAKQQLATEAAAERKTAAKLMRAHMDFQRAEVATNSGKSLMASDKTDDAIVEFRNAISFDSDYIEAHLELAKALEKLGNAPEAAAEREKARAIESRGENLSPGQPPTDAAPNP